MTSVRELLTLSKSDDWHSPLEYVEAARYTLGGRIDRDPASCVLANTMLVKATYIYTEHDDGLSKLWDVPDENGVEGARRPATIWHNPPSSSDSADMVADWWIKLAREYEGGRVSAFVFFAFRAAAIQSMAYQAKLAGVIGPHATWRCEPGRVKFLRPRQAQGAIEVVQELPKPTDGTIPTKKSKRVGKAQEVPKQTDNTTPIKKPKKPRKGQERFSLALPGFETPRVDHAVPVGATIDDLYERGEQPMHDSALLCMGPNDVLVRFRESFAPLGHILPPAWRP